MPSYPKLKMMVKISIDQKLRVRNFDARHGKIETGAVVKSRKGLSGVEGGKGFCYQWKEKDQCSKGDQCSFRHARDDHAPEPTPRAAPPSEPSVTRGRSTSRKRSARGRSQTGRILRQPCRYCLKGTCTRSPCDVNSIKLNRDAKQGTSVCSRTFRLKNNRVRSRERASKTEKAKTKVRQLLRKLYLNCVVSRKTPSRQNFRKA